MPVSNQAHFVRPNFDVATEYGSYYMAQAAQYASRRMQVTDLYMSDATRENIFKSMEEMDPIFCYWLGHGNCYSEDTEVLTEDGWKNFYEIKPNEKIATLNKDTDELEYHLPLNNFKYKYNGKMLLIDGKRVNLLVTPNHKLYTSWQGRINGEFGWLPYKFIQAKDLGKSGIINTKRGFVSTGKTMGWNLKFKRTAKWNCETTHSFLLPPCNILTANGNGIKERPFKEIDIDDWLKFFGIWLAEGSVSLGSVKGTYIISISQNDDEKRKIMKEIVDKISNVVGFSAWLEETNAKSKAIKFKNKQLYLYLKQFGKSKDKYIPKWIKQLPPDKLKILLDHMVLGDGYIDRMNKLNYSSASKRLIDDVHEIALKIGQAGTIHQDKRTGVYVIRITDGDVIVSKKQRKWIDYDGYVYCIEVPNNLLYVRRNGRACWCGNSDVYTAQNQETVMQTCTDNERLIGRVLLLLSCSCGIRLGPDTANKGALSVFAFAVDFIWAATGDIQTDPYSGGFFEAINTISNSVVDGYKTGEAFDRSMAVWNQWIDYWASSPDPYASMVVEYMVQDRDGMRLFGDPTTRITSIQPPIEGGAVQLTPLIIGEILTLLSIIA